MPGAPGKDARAPKLRVFTLVRDADGWTESIITSDYRFDVSRDSSGRTDSITATPL
jgi:hypothetical protein